MSVVVIGAGQAGLAVSHELRAAGIEHVVLERHRVAEAWRRRWDSFTLVTPNWTLRLPGRQYAGPEPEGHVSRDEIVDFLTSYAADKAGSVQEGVAVSALEPGSATARFHLRTSEGDLAADTVVVCTGAYQRPHRPEVVAGFPSSVAVLDATAYRSPGELPPGRILLIGSGQTGVQLAEELHLAGRDVVLACGRAPWAPRRLHGVDIITWLDRAGFYDQPLSALPTRAARLVANVQASGAAGGHDLHFRVLRDMGVPMAGHLTGVTGGRVTFADDLAESVAFGDARLADIRRVLQRWFGADAPELPEPEPFVASPVLTADLADFGAVICTSGFRPDYTRWVRFPVFDDDGFPVVDDQLATAVPGLYFCGVHFLRKRRSSLLWGVGDDAGLVVSTIQREHQLASQRGPLAR